MQFRKKPVVVEARLFTFGALTDLGDWLGDSMRSVQVNHGKGTATIKIKTLEGCLDAKLGDWIIKGVKGEFYPCKPDIFELTHEKAE